MESEYIRLQETYKSLCVAENQGRLEPDKRLVDNILGNIAQLERKWLDTSRDQRRLLLLNVKLLALIQHQHPELLLDLEPCSINRIMHSTWRPSEESRDREIIECLLNGCPHLFSFSSSFVRTFAGFIGNRGAFYQIIQGLAAPALMEIWNIGPNASFDYDLLLDRMAGPSGGISGLNVVFEEFHLALLGRKSVKKLLKANLPTLYYNVSSKFLVTIFFQWKANPGDRRLLDLVFLLLLHIVPTGDLLKALDFESVVTFCPPQLTFAFVWCLTKNHELFKSLCITPSPKTETTSIINILQTFISYFSTEALLEAFYFEFAKVLFPYLKGLYESTIHKRDLKKMLVIENFYFMISIAGICLSFDEASISLFREICKKRFGLYELPLYASINRTLDSVQGLISSIPKSMIFSEYFAFWLDVKTSRDKSHLKRNYPVDFVEEYRAFFSDASAATKFYGGFFSNEASTSRTLKAARLEPRQLSVQFHFKDSDEIINIDFIEYLNPPLPVLWLDHQAKKTAEFLILPVIANVKSLKELLQAIADVHASLTSSRPVENVVSLSEREFFSFEAFGRHLSPTSIVDYLLWADFFNWSKVIYALWTTFFMDSYLLHLPRPSPVLFPKLFNFIWPDFMREYNDLNALKRKYCPYNLD